MPELKHPDSSAPYWFPVRRYAQWGWGLPAVWQGWVVLVAYGLGMALTYLFILPRNRNVAGIVIAALTIAVVFACYLKGEPQSRRKDVSE